jgi:hypothetical protein
MSIAPGMSFTADRINVTAGAATAPNNISNGVGFMSNGNLAIDTDAPAGNRYDAGFRLSALGAIYGTTTPNADDVLLGGLRITQVGAVVYEAAAMTIVVNGNPITANGRLATT